MSVVCPTVLTDNLLDYDRLLKNVSFVPRLQIDLMDGVFAPTKSVQPSDIYWLDGQLADVHMMFQNPESYLETLIAKKPNMIILHAESDGDLSEMFDRIQAAGIKAGICVLPETSVESVRHHIERLDPILVFGGRLGYNGGKADLNQAEKAGQAKSINPNIEAGWDGGGNADNAKQLAEAGIDVVNAGSAIQAADDPQSAWQNMTRLVTN